MPSTVSDAHCVLRRRAWATCERTAAELTERLSVGRHWSSRHREIDWGHWRLRLRICRYDAPVHWWRRCPFLQRRVRRITIQTSGAMMIIKRNQMMGALTTSLHFVSEYSGSALTSHPSVAEGRENCRKSTDVLGWTIARASRSESTTLVSCRQRPASAAAAKNRTGRRRLQAVVRRPVSRSQSGQRPSF